MKQKNVKNQKENSKPTTNTNIVGIDPSTTSTGLCINGKMYSIFRETSNSVTKKGKYTKWYKIVNEQIDVFPIPNRIKKSIYSEEELSKLKMYELFSQKVVGIINSIITSDKERKNTTVVIEGYSYSSDSGHLIDLVTFSTLIRYKLFNHGYNIIVVSPSSLKLWTAQFSYNPIKEPLNKSETRFKTIWRSPHSGNAGGKFTKTDMFNAIIDNDKLSDDWKKFLQSHYDEISSMNKIPNPIEDLNDAYLLYNILKFGYN